MESNKENEERHQAVKSMSQGRLPLSSARANAGADTSRSRDDGSGAKEKDRRGFMRRIMRGGGGARAGPREGQPSPSPNLGQRAEGAKKNFVKANKLAASNSRSQRSSSYLKASGPGTTGSRLQVSRSTLGGSSRSLNSEPGSGERGKFSRSQDTRKTFHYTRTGRNFQARSTTPSSSAVTRNSLSSAPEIVVTPVAKSVRRLQAPSQRETIESLTAKLEEVKVGLEECQNENSELRTMMEISEKENKRKIDDLASLLVENSKRQQDDLKNLVEMNKCQLESQRLEFKEEIRKLLSFKEPVNKKKEKDGSFQNSSISQVDSFRNTSDRLLNKIQRLSARMSLQDSDMKELMEVKSWNEKKLESELQKLDSAKKAPAGGSLLKIPTSGSDFISQSEPNLSSMFDTDETLVSKKLQRLAPSMNALMNFSPSSPAVNRRLNSALT